MRSFLASAAALLSIASATPLAPWVESTPPPAGTVFYNLKTASTTPALANQWVSLKTGSTSYTLASTEAAATKFFARKVAGGTTYTFLNADDTHQIALLGSKSALLYFVDVVNATADKIPAGQLMEWGTFVFDPAKLTEPLSIRDGSTLTNRTFVAVEDAGGYKIALYDGATSVTEKIVPITITAPTSKT